MLKRTRISVAIGAAFGIGLAGLAPSAMAQQQLDRVEVTGSSIKRIEGETALPVQVITREDIQRTGATNVEQLMQTVSAATSSGNNVSRVGRPGATTLGLSERLAARPELAAHAGADQRQARDAVRLRLHQRQRVGRRQQHSARGDRARRDPQGRRLGGVRLGRDRRCRQLHPAQGLPGPRDRRRVRHAGRVVGRLDVPRHAAPTASAISTRTGFNVMVTVELPEGKGAVRARPRLRAVPASTSMRGNDTTSGNTFPANIVDAGTGVRSGRAIRRPGLPGALRDRQPAVRRRSRGLPLRSVAAGHAAAETERAGIFASGRFRLTPDAELYGEASFAKNESAHGDPADADLRPVHDPAEQPAGYQFPCNAFTAVPTSAAAVSTILLRRRRARSTRPRSCSRRPAAPRPTCWCAGAPRRIGDRDFTDTSEASRLNFGAQGRGRQLGLRRRLPVHARARSSETLNDGYALYTRIMPLLNSGAINFFGPQHAGGPGGARRDEVHGDSLETETSMQSLYGKLSRDLMQMKAGALARGLRRRDRARRSTS